jgi:hypothetical protein
MRGKTEAWISPPFFMQNNNVGHKKILNPKSFIAKIISIENRILSTPKFDSLSDKFIISINGTIIICTKN